MPISFERKNWIWVPSTYTDYARRRIRRVLAPKGTRRRAPAIIVLVSGTALPVALTIQLALLSAPVKFFNRIVVFVVEGPAVKSYETFDFVPGVMTTANAVFLVALTSNPAAVHRPTGEEIVDS